MQINLVAESSVASAPAGFTAAVQAAAAVFEQADLGNYSVNISYGWGTIDGTTRSDLATSQSGVFSLGGSDRDYYVAFSDLKALLSSKAVTDTQIAALSSLPATSPISGDYIVSSSQLKALGAFGGDASGLDGSIGFNLSDTSAADLSVYIAQAAVTEIAHALGLISGDVSNFPATLDLYRFTAPGVRSTASGQASYLSIDDGRTNLANYATSFDTTLFQGVDGDSFDIDPYNPNQGPRLTDLDHKVLQLLGLDNTGTDIEHYDAGLYSVEAGGLTVVSSQDFTGNGTLVVDLDRGQVYAGSQIYAVIPGLDGVQLGSSTSVVLGASSGTDLLYAGSGSDSVYNRGGTDYIQGGTGSDQIIGGNGTQVFYSRGGQDTMLGGSGSSFMQAGSTSGSVDTFYGNGGADYVYGGAGTTTLVGGTGYEQLTGSVAGAGLTVLRGGTGTDVFYGGAGTNLLYEGSGRDVFAGTTGTDLIYGGTGESAVFGGAGLLAVTTGAGNQYVQAGSGHLFFNDTAAGLHAGRSDRIDNFAGSGGVDLYLPAAMQGATSFVAGDGGTAVVTALSGGQATLFASGADLATVQAHTHFTLA